MQYANQLNDNNEAIDWVGRGTPLDDVISASVVVNYRRERVAEYTPIIDKKSSACGDWKQQNYSNSS